MNGKFLMTGLSALAVAGVAQAQPTIDGTLDASYGAALSVQTVETQFGDEDGLADPNGGELDAMYLDADLTNLYIFVSGNLETDTFNKLNLFIDSRAGGENVLSGTPNYDFGDLSSNLAGTTFAAGFDADFHVIARAGFGNFEVDVVDRQNGTSANVLANTGSAALSGDYGVAIGQTVDFATQAANGSGVTGDALTSPASFALDNSNTAGVLGGTGAADQVAAAAVNTGVEIAIPLADLGLTPGETVSIVAAYSNSNLDFFSNQFLGGLPAGTGNVGGNLDFSGSTPVRFTVPEPASLALLGLGGLAMLRRRA